MSPVVEPVVLAGDRFTFLHIGPRAQVWPTSPAANIAVLGRTDMVSRPLPVSNVPSSPDCVSGQWIGRVLDSGELSLTFPNREASDGTPWRERFDPTGHLQFIEILDNGVLDSCCVIDTAAPDQQQVQVHGQDGWFLLKKAFERDWIVTQAPRDVIERATRVWVPVMADNFPAGTLSSQWSPSTGSGGGAWSLGASGGLLLTAPAANNAYAQIYGSANCGTTGTWRATASIQTVALGPEAFLSLQVDESSGDYYGVRLQAGNAIFYDNNSATIALTQLASATSYGLTLESDGEWLWAFVNGQLVGGCRRSHASTASLATLVEAGGTSLTGSTARATVSGVLVETEQPFLMPGSDEGEYLLPAARR